ncbi:hypothetical protein DFH09DRAFT_1146488 [Mycena vulgaris]|nr:hypothetical protein DFH09DRAFT_1146488 [Mycena vulgaris]
MRRCIPLPASVFCFALWLLAISTNVTDLGCPPVDKNGTALGGVQRLGNNFQCGYLSEAGTVLCDYFPGDTVALLPDSPSTCPDNLLVATASSVAASSTVDSPISPGINTLSSTHTSTAPSGLHPSSSTSSSTTATTTTTSRPSSSRPAASQELNTSRKRVPPGAIAGAIVGAGALVGVSVLLLWLRRHRQRSDPRMLSRQYIVDEINLSQEKGHRLDPIRDGVSAADALENGDPTNETLTQRMRTVEAQLAVLLTHGVPEGSPPGYSTV